MSKADLEIRAEEETPEGVKRLGGAMAYCPLHNRIFDVRNPTLCEDKERIGSERCRYFQGCFGNSLTTIAVYCSHPSHVKEKVS